MQANQNVKNGEVAKLPKQALSPHRLERTTFQTSREMDFFSEKELITQTGHDVREWPLVIVKELIDNALDACEEGDIVPVIHVRADATGITVTDNGPGIPEATLRGVMDFTIRVSNREAYVSPCRGAQGNALKTLLPMPWVLDPEHGKLVVTAHGKRHEIRCGADPISQRPIIKDNVVEVAKSKKQRNGEADKASFGSGTEIRLEWSERVGNEEGTLWPFKELLPLGSRYDWPNEPKFADIFRALIEGYAVFNPHATISLNWFGQESGWKATDPKWEKWKPNKPTSAHWYDLRHAERLIGAYITHDRDAGKDRLVSDFVAKFCGLSGSPKQTTVLGKADMKRMKLSEFVVDGKLDSDRIAKLLTVLQGATRPVQSKNLGIIGKDHLKTRLLAMGVQEESFTYSQRLAKDGLPWVLESAFGWLGEAAKDQRKIYTGANWSSTIKNPFRSFGSTGQGLETTLAKFRVTCNEPVVFVLHLAHPRVEYTDRGKSALIIDK